MKYTLTWKKSALDQLATLWAENSDERAEIAAAADQVDRLLRVDPELRGSRRSERRRVMAVPPLLIVFEVRPADRIVTVLSVRRLGIGAS